jgi:hypothetical protein
LKIKKVPKTVYEIELEPCCEPGRNFIESGFITIENGEVVFSKRLERFYGIRNCMYCGAKIEVVDI